jgi:hypothetical protein
MKTLKLWACGSVPTYPDDEHVPGVYEIQVPEHLADAEAAACVLDVFHCNVSVKCLEDFSFSVYDGERQIHQVQGGAYTRASTGKFVAKVLDWDPTSLMGHDLGTVVHKISCPDLGYEIGCVRRPPTARNVQIWMVFGPQAFQLNGNWRYPVELAEAKHMAGMADRALRGLARTACTQKIVQQVVKDR